VVLIFLKTWPWDGDERTSRRDRVRERWTDLLSFINFSGIFAWEDVVWNITREATFERGNGPLGREDNFIGDWTVLLFLRETMQTGEWWKVLSTPSMKSFPELFQWAIGLWELFMETISSHPLGTHIVTDFDSIVTATAIGLESSQESWLMVPLWRRSVWSPVPNIDVLRRDRGRDRREGRWRGGRRGREWWGRKQGLWFRWKSREDVTLILLFLIRLDLIQHNEARRIHRTREVRDRGLHVSIDQLKWEIRCLVIWLWNTTEIESRGEGGRGCEDWEVFNMKELMRGGGGGGRGEDSDEVGSDRTGRGVGEGVGGYGEDDLNGRFGACWLSPDEATAREVVRRGEGSEWSANDGLRVKRRRRGGGGRGVVREGGGADESEVDGWVEQLLWGNGRSEEVGESGIRQEQLIVERRDGQMNGGEERGGNRRGELVWSDESRVMGESSRRADQKSMRSDCQWEELIGVRGVRLLSLLKLCRGRRSCGGYQSEEIDRPERVLNSFKRELFLVDGKEGGEGLDLLRGGINLSEESRGRSESERESRGGRVCGELCRQRQIWIGGKEMSAEWGRGWEGRWKSRRSVWFDQVTGGEESLNGKGVWSSASEFWIPDFELWWAGGGRRWRRRQGESNNEWLKGMSPKNCFWWSGRVGHRQAWDLRGNTGVEWRTVELRSERERERERRRSLTWLRRLVW
jgi:hypothetical protein